MKELLHEIFDNIPRLGPGSDKITQQVFSNLNLQNKRPSICDIGCGNGMQTKALAEKTEADIYAIDNHTPYLHQLKNEAEKKSYNGNIIPIAASMDQLPFKKNSFDVIWSEGSIYIIGLENGLKYWKEFIKNDGYICISEAAYFQNNVPQKISDFWKKEYPAVTNISKLINRIRSTGLIIQDYIRLPDTAWTDEYYNPLELRLKTLREQYENNITVLEFIEEVQAEIDLFRNFSEYYGYLFFTLRK